MANSADLVYQIRTHLLYELKWMIFAASRFEADTFEPGMAVALIDSATVHARNLLEFGYERKDRRGTKFVLEVLGGTPFENDDWSRWANNRVTHMYRREHFRAPWPEGITNDQQNRLRLMADAVLTRLEGGGRSIPDGRIKEAFDPLLAAARSYLSDPTEANHQAVQSLYDDSRDDRPYAEPT